MNVHSLVHARIVAALQALQGEGALPGGLDLGNVEVLPPRDAVRGDLASNAALVLARQTGMKPHDIAARLAEKLKAHADIAAAQVAGAGFLNLRLAPRFWHAVVTAILTEGKSFGRADLGRGERINVAYVSTSPAKPLRASHIRTAVLGDALASLLAFVGYDVTRACWLRQADPALAAELQRELALVDIRYDVLLSAAAAGEAAIAHHRDKLGRGFKHFIAVLDAGDMGGHAAVQAAMAGPSAATAELEVKVCQPVRFLRGGEPVRASTLRGLVDEVGADVVRFMLLYRRSDASLELDLAKAVEQSKDNPLFHVQYAHARAKSVFRNAREILPELAEGSPAVVRSDLSLLSDVGEIGLIKQLAQFPTVVEAAAGAREPYRLTLYLYDLASSFHRQYARGHDLPHLRFIRPCDGTLTAARLALVQANALVLAAGLELLGVLAPLEMR